MVAPGLEDVHQVVLEGCLLFAQNETHLAVVEEKIDSLVLPHSILVQMKLSIYRRIPFHDLIREQAHVHHEIQVELEVEEVVLEQLGRDVPDDNSSGTILRSALASSLFPHWLLLDNAETVRG